MVRRAYKKTRILGRRKIYDVTWYDKQGDRHGVEVDTGTKAAAYHAVKEAHPNAVKILVRGYHTSVR